MLFFIYKINNVYLLFFVSFTLELKKKQLSILCEKWVYINKFVINLLNNYLQNK